MKPESIALVAALIAVFSSSLTVLLAVYSKRKRAESAASSISTDTSPED